MEIVTTVHLSLVDRRSVRDFFLDTEILNRRVFHASSFEMQLRTGAVQILSDKYALAGNNPIDVECFAMPLGIRDRLSGDTMQKLPISCFIIAKNEADRIGRAVQSVREWVDEVIVVDSFSTDDTVETARAEGARVVQKAWLGFGQQKRFSEDLCRNNWLLNIDADEVVTEDLAREIADVFANGEPQYSCYGMAVALVYPGRTRPRAWARDHFCVRLYDRRVVRFRNSSLHDSVVTGSHKAGRFASALYHHSIRSFEDMRRKLDERMWLAVADGDQQPRSKIFLRLITEMPMHFFKYYIVRGHVTGGWAGLKYASLQAWFRFARIYRLWRQGRPREIDGGADLSHLQCSEPNLRD